MTNVKLNEAKTQLSDLDLDNIAGGNWFGDLYGAVRNFIFQHDQRAIGRIIGEHSSGVISPTNGRFHR